ncbi:methionine gamma-lyase [Oceanospirillum sediminis]|uniref:L-methionine gamma-lyase n=1 Tax=Oceanospirillum sediminis TaxID=2760088 RepID=A0A839ITT1_9GAMM|nr:methionine gamma-lyase [Oceanospirillum sediminis]MBB1488863.1 methionine gamma-lyase [Oceanospirillum sediminis]
MNNDAQKAAFSTRAIHYGYDSSSANGSLTPPIYMTSTFAFDSVEQGGERFAGEAEGPIYSRLGNPTQSVLETRLADLEEGEAALAMASGMGAISATFWTLLKAGDHVVADKTLYGCTFAFLEHGLKKFGVDVSYVDCCDLSAVKNALTDQTRIVYFESPVNPTLRVMDIAAISQLVHNYSNDIKVIVDNTYCTPALQRPLTLGADLVVHSATKYLGGHGDLIAGAVVGDEETVTRIRLEGLKDMTGAVISPMTAFLIQRGLKTLELRMERHSQSALAIARWLAEQPEIEQVYYPGLESSPFYQLAQQQMTLPGGMIAFELKGGLEKGKQFMNNLKMIKRAVSLGDAETLCQHPASMTHSTYTPEERMAHDISEGLVRISVGLEDVKDIQADLSQALSVC